MADSSDTDWLHNIHRPGALSIVVQGGLSRDNLAEISANCRHWRELFPAAEIILSLSGTDLLHGNLQNGLLSHIRLTDPYVNDGTARHALDSILFSCDRIALCEPMQPLPPIKADSRGPNNINLQIAAAKNGLRHAGNPHVLRIRSDLILRDHSFLEQYAAGATLPRGDAAFFSSRILISWLYTLNPYTIERLPMHFSDWFHFGMTKDVRRLWEVPFVTLDDAEYYKRHPYAPHSNPPERLFFIRLADEQHLVYNVLRGEFRDLVLDCHNDQTSVTRAMDILADNFVVADINAQNCAFPKYGFEFGSHEKTLHCITAGDWRAMATYRQTDYRITLSHKIREWHDRHRFAREQAAAPLPLPAHFDADRLTLQGGALTDGQAVANPADGLLFSTPPLPLQPGHYIIALNPTLMQGSGIVTLRATFGAELLSERRITVRDGLAELTLPLHIFHPDAVVDVTCQAAGLTALSISALTVARWDEDAPALPCYYEAADLHIARGRLEQDCIVADKPDGRLCYGPYIDLPPGAHVARVDLRQLKGPGLFTVAITCDVGARVLAQGVFRIDAQTSAGATLAFDVAPPGAQKLEVVCGLRGLPGAAVRGILIAQSDDPRISATDLLLPLRPPAWRRGLAALLGRDPFARVEDLPT